MNIFEVIVLGLVQGLTEFIPISSSGHLVIFQNIFGRESDHLFLEAINIGTFLALLVYFAPKIVSILQDIFVRKQYNLARNIIITSVPAGIVGYLSADFIGNSAFFGSIVVVMITLLTIGVLMIVLEKLPRLDDIKDGSLLSPLRAFIIGAAQMIALIPGVSRSGSTIITGRLMGLSAKDAAEYSFLASLPIMAGVTLKVIVGEPQYLADNAAMLLLGNAVAFVSGLLAVRFLMRFLATRSLAVFGWYRVVLAGVIAVTLLVQ